MKQFNIAEARARLSHLVDQAAAGEEVVIAKSGVPMAKLVRFDDETPRKFTFGTLRDVITDELAIAVDAPLPVDGLT